MQVTLSQPHGSRAKLPFPAGADDRCQSARLCCSARGAFQDHYCRARRRLKNLSGRRRRSAAAFANCCCHLVLMKYEDAVDVVMWWCRDAHGALHHCWRLADGQVAQMLDVCRCRCRCRHRQQQQQQRQQWKQEGMLLWHGCSSFDRALQPRQCNDEVVGVAWPLWAADCASSPRGRSFLRPAPCRRAPRTASPSPPYWSRSSRAVGQQQLPVHVGQRVVTALRGGGAFAAGTAQLHAASSRGVKSSARHGAGSPATGNTSA